MAAASGSSSDWRDFPDLALLLLPLLQPFEELGQVLARHHRIFFALYNKRARALSTWHANTLV